MSRDGSSKLTVQLRTASALQKAHSAGRGPSWKLFPHENQHEAAGRTCQDRSECESAEEAPEAAHEGGGHAVETGGLSQQESSL